MGESFIGWSSFSTQVGYSEAFRTPNPPLFYASRRFHKIVHGLGISWLFLKNECLCLFNYIRIYLFLSRTVSHGRDAWKWPRGGPKPLVINQVNFWSLSLTFRRKFIALPHQNSGIYLGSASLKMEIKLSKSIMVIRAHNRPSLMNCFFCKKLSNSKQENEIIKYLYTS